MKNNQNYNKPNKPSGVEKLTLWEQLRKGNKIEVKFLNVKEDKTLKDLQLAVFINDKLRYVTRKGAFSIKNYSYQTLVRKGWKFSYETRAFDRIIFEEQKDFDKFISFCKELRDCPRIMDMYKQCGKDLINSFSN